MTFSRQLSKKEKPGDQPAGPPVGPWRSERLHESSYSFICRGGGENNAEGGRSVLQLFRVHGFIIVKPLDEFSSVVKSRLNHGRIRQDTVVYSKKRA